MVGTELSAIHAFFSFALHNSPMEWVMLVNLSDFKQGYKICTIMVLCFFKINKTKIFNKNFSGIYKQIRVSNKRGNTLF